MHQAVNVIMSGSPLQKFTGPNYRVGDI